MDISRLKSNLDKINGDKVDVNIWKEIVCDLEMILEFIIKVIPDSMGIVKEILMLIAAGLKMLCRSMPLGNQ